MISQSLGAFLDLKFPFSSILPEKTRQMKESNFKGKKFVNSVNLCMDSWSDLNLTVANSVSCCIMAVCFSAILALHSLKV